MEDSITISKTWEHHQQVLAMRTALIIKFQQCEALPDALFGDGDRILIEATSKVIMGKWLKYPVTTTKLKDWQGQNMLGDPLMELNSFGTIGDQSIHTESNEKYKISCQIY